MTPLSAASLAYGCRATRAKYGGWRSSSQQHRCPTPGAIMRLTMAAWNFSSSGSRFTLASVQVGIRYSKEQLRS